MTTDNEQTALEPPDRIWLPADTDADTWNVLAKNPTRNWKTGEPANNIEYTRVSAASTAPLVDGDLISRQDAVRVARDHDLLHSSGHRCYEGEVIARKIAALPARTPSVATAAQIVSQAITEGGFGDSPPPVRSWEDGKHGLLAAASPAAPQEDALVDEVQHRMDQIVEAAVEWHQAGREGGEWFEAAEKLGAAINSLLELRSDPKSCAHECFCGTELEAGLCPNGHDPIMPASNAATGDESPIRRELTAQQQAYNQGIEDAKCAIRAESQGGGYWAAAYINAIARRCSPFRYTGMPAEMDGATREQVLQAITDIQEARESHVQWGAHLQDSTREDCQGCADHSAHIGDADYHEEWIAKYDNVNAVLARTPFATPTPSQRARDAARQAAVEISSTFGLKFQEASLSQVAAIISRHFPAGTETVGEE